MRISNYLYNTAVDTHEKLKGLNNCLLDLSEGIDESFGPDITNLEMISVLNRTADCLNDVHTMLDSIIQVGKAERSMLN